jgi:hypothetical protein
MIKFTARDWDMSDWPPSGITVEGIVMAVEGCGDNNGPLAVIDDEGNDLRIRGVRRNGHRVEIAVERPPA